MIERLASLVALALAALACAVLWAHPTGSAVNERIRFLEPRDGAAVLNQCSRSTPEPGESYFTAKIADVKNFEQELDNRLTKAGYFDKLNADRNGSKSGKLSEVHSVTDNSAFGVEVIGIVRNGRRYLYGNYFPANYKDHKARIAAQAQLSKDNSAWDYPVGVCDGGQTFFGAEYEIQSMQVTHLDFNGYG